MSGWWMRCCSLLGGLLCCALDVKLAELLEISFCRRLGHHFYTTVVFRKGDDVADAIFAGDEHDEAVEAKGNAPVRRRAEFEGLQDVAKEELLFLLIDAKNAEHLGLKIGLMNSKATAADLDAVEHDIVGHSTDFPVFSRIEESSVIRAGTGEGVVDGIPFLFLFIPGKEREINDPEEIQGRGAFEGVEHFCHSQADTAEGFAGGFPLVGAK